MASMSDVSCSSAWPPSFCWKSGSALRPSVRDIGDGDTDALVPAADPATHDADRALGGDAGVDDGNAPGALPDEAAEKIAQHAR